MLKNGRHTAGPGTECEMDITRRRKCYETAKKLYPVKGSVHVHRLRTRRRKRYETAKKLYPVKGSVHVHRPVNQKEEALCNSKEALLTEGKCTTA